MTTTYLIVAAVWIVSAIIAGMMALGRKRDGALWMLAGYVFGPLAILPLLFFGDTD